jgi:hypothetical protein
MPTIYRSNLSSLGFEPKSQLALRTIIGYREQPYVWSAAMCCGYRPRLKSRVVYVCNEVDLHVNLWQLGTSSEFRVVFRNASVLTFACATYININEEVCACDRLLNDCWFFLQRLTVIISSRSSLCSQDRCRITDPTLESYPGQNNKVYISGFSCVVYLNCGVSAYSYVAINLEGEDGCSSVH